MFRNEFNDRIEEYIAKETIKIIYADEERKSLKIFFNDGASFEVYVDCCNMGFEFFPPEIEQEDPK